MTSALSHRLVPALAAAAMLAVLTGCSSLPTAPDLASAPGSDRISGSLATQVSDDAPTAPQGGGSADVNPPPPPNPVSVTQKIVGVRGGSVHLGRFTLVVPPRALHGRALITMSLPDLDGLECDLQIAPASANDFAAPLRLSCDYGGVGPLGDSVRLAMTSYDPVQAIWVDVPGTQVDEPNEQVTAPILHFSRFRVSYEDVGVR